MNAQRRHSLSALIAVVAVVGLPTANAVAAVTSKAPSTSSAKAKAKAAAARAAAAKAAAAKAAAAKAGKKAAATTTIAVVTGNTVVTGPTGTITMGPPLDPLPTTPKAQIVQGAHTYVGDTVEMDQWGPVTVTIDVENGKITDVSADMPMERPRSNFINSRIQPFLSKQAIQLQSSHVDLIGGATKSCMAYSESLQSAIDKAGVKP